MIRSRHSKKRKARRKKNLVVPLTHVPVSRLTLVFFIICLGLGGLLGRLAWLQIFQAGVLEARARDLQTEYQRTLGTRRSILDRRGRLLAIDEQRFRVWAHPRYFSFFGDSSSKIRTPYEVSKKLADILSISVDDLSRVLLSQKSGIKLAEDLQPEVASEIQKLRISGIDLEPYPQRVYPQGTLFANVIGFLDHDRVPQAGLELSLNKKLLRQERASNLRRGGDGTPLPVGIKPGVLDSDDQNLHLTLDTRLQEVAVKELGQQIKQWRAKKGVAIVMNVFTGELLALASTPTYDPNKYWKYSPKLFKEWSVQSLFEPGSTFKPINLALALQEGVIDPDGDVNDTGSVYVGGWSLANWDRKANGLLDYPEVLQVSSNVGMINIMKKLDPSDYWEWLGRLGIKETPNTDLLGAVGGQLKSKETFVNQPIESAVASFGQGFSITPLKLAQLHALIANGGKLVTPHVTKGFSSRHAFTSSKGSEPNQLLNPEITKTVLEWMETVVEKGSGKGAQVNGYRIGGKTGTAQKAQDGKNYTAKICSFVATLPIDDPKYVVLVVVDEPQKRFSYGSTVAVPVAKKIIESLLVLEKIPPSNEKEAFLSAQN